MKFKPFHDNVVVSKLEHEEQRTPGGIVVPSLTARPQNMAEVVAVGPGRITLNGALVPCNVNVGDKVLLSSFAGSNVLIDGSEYLVVSYSDIIGVIEG